jgi:glycosyltransferase involved in cell wall biosynthesis
VPERLPVVSVVIKAYNHEAYVEQAIRSVLEQSFQDFEIVVTDDASTDATPHKIAQFTDSRIRFERFTANQGIAAAMNATVRRARGLFVAILNSDDFMLPDRLATQVRFLRERADVAAVFSVPLQVDDSGRPDDGFGSIFAIPFAHAEPTRRDWLRHFFLHGNTLCAPSAMIRNSAFRAIGPDDVRLAHLADLDRWIKLLRWREIHVMDRPLTAFRVRANRANASAPRPDTVLREVFESFEIFKRYRTFEPAFLREIFAEDVARLGITGDRSNGALLAEIALSGTKAWHRLFALDSLFEAAREEQDVRRLRELTAKTDAFSVLHAADSG